MNQTVRTDINHFIKSLTGAKTIAKAEGINLSFDPARAPVTAIFHPPAPLSPQEVVAIFEKAGGRKFELQYVPVHALQAQFDAAQDDLSKAFAILMLFYAQGNEVSMTDTLKAFPIKLTTVKQYAERVSQLLPIAIGTA